MRVRARAKYFLGVGGQGPSNGPDQVAVYLAVCHGSEYKKIIKTVGYGICSVEPVATTFYLRASQIIRNFQFSLIKIRLSNSMKTCQTSWRCPGYRFCDFAFRGRCLRFQHLAKLSVLLRRILLQTTLRDYSRLWALPPRARPNLYR